MEKQAVQSGRWLALVGMMAGASCGESGGVGLSVISASGTTLMATKTATGFYERRVDYDWTLTRTATPTSLTVPPRATGAYDSTLTATRTLVSSTEVTGVRGEICVTNDGAVATEGLTIVDQVQYKTGRGTYRDLPGGSFTLSPSEPLGPGETRCFTYDIAFTPVAGAEYRNTARVTITNHSGSLGTPTGPGGGSGVAANFALPSTYTLIETDAEADLVDVGICPSGFTCTWNEPGTWHLTDTTVLTFTSFVQTPRRAPCGTSAPVDNTATLTESTTGTAHVASTTVTIYTGDCAAAAGPGGGGDGGARGGGGMGGGYGGDRDGGTGGPGGHGGGGGSSGMNGGIGTGGGPDRDAGVGSGGADGGVESPIGGQGCTPGYWGNHTESWQTYTPTMLVSGAFSYANLYGLGSYTLAEALSFSGGTDTTGAARILLRAAVAAVLNAEHSGVSYPISKTDVVALVDAAMLSADRDAMLTLAALLDGYNNAGCPLN
jgi:hypothetical protein